MSGTAARSERERRPDDPGQTPHSSPKPPPQTSHRFDPAKSDAEEGLQASSNRGSSPEGSFNSR